MYQYTLTVAHPNGSSTVKEFKRRIVLRLEDCFRANGALAISNVIVLPAAEFVKVSLTETKECPRKVKPKPEPECRTAPTHEVRIYVTLPQGWAIQNVWNACQYYCNLHHLRMRVTECMYIFDEDGLEKGVEICLTSNPRCPLGGTYQHALSLARILKAELQQKQVMVVGSNETNIIYDDDLT